jgi:hypothetical protein
MTHVNIRPAQAGDYDALCGLFDEVDALHRAGLPSVFQKPPGAVRDKDYLLTLLADQAVLLLVAEIVTSQ